ncbi:hypothetical protein L3Q82_006492 [Scortum barcoo]|uniref:Uncharacterized protein n=1 Tax=Scortum barcoo TaxID=214431 RepID=A0ACB8X0U5_9TELE|nr:hypothetical protein L3Q82_006492 [Scortum barcoo]
MAAREKCSKHPKKRVNATFETSSIDSTAVEEKLFGQVEEEEEEDGEDGPVVFICGKCKLPVGDSESWDGSEDSENQIRLKREYQRFYITLNDLRFVTARACSLVVDLICQGCHSVLGMVYASTPKNMDHKRFTFCLNVADIDSYVLGSANQMLAAEGPKEQLVTLEYRSIVEQQLTEQHFPSQRGGKRSGFIIHEVSSAFHGNNNSEETANQHAVSKGRAMHVPNGVVPITVAAGQCHPKRFMLGTREPQLSRLVSTVSRGKCMWYVRQVAH